MSLAGKNEPQPKKVAAFALVVRRLSSSGDGTQQEVERVVAVGQQVFGAGEPSPAVDAPQSGLDALDIDVRAAVGHEVARVADIFRRAVVELRDGKRDGRCREVAVGADLHAQARVVGQPPPAQSAARSRLLRADVFHMELVGDTLGVAPHEGGAGAVGVVLHRAAAVIFHGVEHARGFEGHAEAHQVGDVLARGVGGHRFADADRTVGSDRIRQIQFRTDVWERVVCDGFHFAVAGRKGEACELRFGFGPHLAVGVFPGLAHAEIVVRGCAVEVGLHGTGQQLDVAQAVGTDEAALRIERDRESFARNGFVRHAERPGSPRSADVSGPSG